MTLQSAGNDMNIEDQRDFSFIDGIELEDMKKDRNNFVE